MREDDHPTKRRKLNASLPEGVIAATACQNQDVPHKGLDRPISPPPSKRKSPVVPKTLLTPTGGSDDVPELKSALALLPANSNAEQVTARKRDDRGGRRINYVRSPVQLTHIEDMAPHQNVDATGLRDVLGDPMIKECWNFNFLFDIDFVM
jgi:tyrosyl-DNA phosphodiesterase-1